MYTETKGKFSPSIGVHFSFLEILLEHKFKMSFNLGSAQRGNPFVLINLQMVAFGSFLSFCFLSITFSCQESHKPYTHNNWFIYICFSHENGFETVLRKGLKNFSRRKQSKFSLKSNLTLLSHLSVSYFVFSSQITDHRN